MNLDGQSSLTFVATIVVCWLCICEYIYRNVFAQSCIVMSFLWDTS